jgi:hypothetical protein
MVMAYRRQLTFDSQRLIFSGFSCKFSTKLYQQSFDECYYDAYLGTQNAWPKRSPLKHSGGPRMHGYFDLEHVIEASNEGLPFDFHLKSSSFVGNERQHVVISSVRLAVQ